MASEERHLVARKPLIDQVGDLLPNPLSFLPRVVVWAGVATVGYWVGRYFETVAAPTLPPVFWILNGAVIIVVALTASEGITEANAWPPFYVLGLVIAVAPQQTDNLSFFEVAAQVATALFIALAFETRALHPRDDLITNLIESVVVFLLIAGALDLLVLMRNDVRSIDPRFVLAALFAAGLILGMLALHHPPTTKTPGGPPPDL
jgi:hypothetical protein